MSPDVKSVNGSVLVEEYSFKLTLTAPKLKSITPKGFKVEPKKKKFWPTDEDEKFDAQRHVWNIEDIFVVTFDQPIDINEVISLYNTLLL